MSWICLSICKLLQASKTVLINRTIMEYDFSDIFFHSGHIFQLYSDLVNDLVLFKLETPAIYNDYVRPIALPEPGQTFYDSVVCYAAGWGATSKFTIISRRLISFPIIFNVFFYIFRRSKHYYRE